MTGSIRQVGGRCACDGALAANRWWQCGLAVALAVGLAGCGGGGGSQPATPITLSQAVPDVLPLVTAQTVTLAGTSTRDEYELALAAPQGNSGTVQVRVNSGNTVLPMLPASTGTAGGGRDEVRQPVVLPGVTTRAAALAPVSRQTVGSTRTFIFEGGPQSVTATLQAEGLRCMIYVDNSTPSGAMPLADAQDMATAMDAIVATDTSLFGPPSDVDHNGMIIVLMTPDVVPPGWGAFYDPDVAGGGNNADMFYTRVPDPTTGDSYSVIRTALLATMAHELQHLINFNSKYMVHGLGHAEETWLDEALALMAEQLNGYGNSLGGAPERVAAWLASPEQYTAELPVAPYEYGNVGASYLLVRYLTDRFGVGILKLLDQSALTGTANVAAATGQPFNSLFLDWAPAVYLNGTGLSTDALYSIPGFNTHATWEGGLVQLNGPQATRVDASSGSPAFEVDIPGGGLRFVRLTAPPAGGLTLHFDAQPADDATAILIRAPKTAP